MHTFFNEIVLSIGGKKISSNSGFNAQIFSILNRVGMSQMTKSTLQYIEGGYEDQDDPDKISAFDAGFVSRQELFCSDTTNKKKIG